MAYQNTEGRRVTLTEGAQGRGEGGNCMEVHHHHQHEVELEIEFWPLEHPTEPPDEDQPVKCPMLSTSAIPVSMLPPESCSSMFDTTFAHLFAHREEAN